MSIVSRQDVPEFGPILPPGRRERDTERERERER